MSSIVIGAAELAVGFFTGSPLLMEMGAVTLLQSALNRPQNTQGPRLSDLKVQVSSYGQFLPVVYGTMRLAGNVIWSTPKIEHAQTQSSGGGGKGGGGPTYTTYTYTASFAVAICEGPIVGIGRIWANGQLISNTNSNAPLTSIINSFAITGYNQSGAMTLYTGSSSQMPDPLMESYLGANCPAYRDTAYVVFENLLLTNYGNQIPNLEFEVITTGSSTQLPFQNNGTKPFAPLDYNCLLAMNGVLYYLGSISGYSTVQCWSTMDGTNWTQLFVDSASNSLMSE